MRNQEGALLGGVRGIVNFGAVEVRGLWVDKSCHKAGYGRKLLAMLEEEAECRSAQLSFLDTYSFQARGFYEKQGYRCFGELTYPTGVKRFYLQKALG